MNPSSLLFVIITVVVSASLTVGGHYVRPWRPALIYIFKPLTMILILAAALIPGTWRNGAYASLIALGLFFSLPGDILLMLPGDHFVQGLGSFLLTHLCYGLAFLPGASAEGFGWGLLILAATGAVILRTIWPGLPARLKGPVSVYVTVIVLMAALAVGESLAHVSASTAAAATGALLFMASDAVLAINRFRRPFRLAPAAVLGCYFAGQLLIALSVGGN